MPHGDLRNTPAIPFPGSNTDIDGSTHSRANTRPAAELSARAAQRRSLLGEMTGGVAHDFRNILAVIDSGLRLAERNYGEPEKVQAFVAAAREGVARGLRLTSRLLAFAKQPELQTCPADANSLLKNLELFLEYGVGSSVRIGLDLSPDIPRCLVEPSQFNAAILNLAINARDAMPNGGEVLISTARHVVKPGALEPAPGTYVRVRVKDNGVGMSERVLENMFEPFFTTKGENGTGLGVPQVCAFMRQIGGYVRVASEQGRGTKFDLFFPAVGLEAALPRRNEVAASPSSPCADVSSTRSAWLAQ
jgi:signal transduction histidine kinase